MNTTGIQTKLDYPIEIIPDVEGYVALLPDLPGCMSSGETITEAVEGLQEAKDLWIEGMVKAGQPVPPPSEIEEFSGKFVLRIPRSLHRSLDYEAKKQGVSLNQYVLHILSERHTLAALENECKMLVRTHSQRISKEPSRSSVGWTYESSAVHVIGGPAISSSRTWRHVRLPRTPVIRRKNITESCHR